MTKSSQITLNVHEAKTHLSRYLVEVEAGHTVIVCRNGVPIAQLAPISKNSPQHARRFGLGKGMGSITKAFFTPLTDDDLPNMGL